eukprot:PhM_4_TR11647/c4_g3_i1/m.68150
MAHPPAGALQPLNDEAVKAFVARLRRETVLCEVPVRIGFRPAGGDAAFVVQKGVAKSKALSREVIQVTLRQQNDDVAIPPEHVKTKRFPFAGYEFKIFRSQISNRSFWSPMTRNRDETMQTTRRTSLCVSCCMMLGPGNDCSNPNRVLLLS